MSNDSILKTDEIKTRTGVVSLKKAFQSIYERSKLSNSKLPTRILQELDQKTLFIAEAETSDEEIPLLCQFLKRAEALKYIETLVIAQNSTVGNAHNRKCTHFKAGKVSALYSDNCRLFRTLISFVAKSHHLKRLVFESIQISVHLLVKLSEALLATKTDLKWFGVKSSPIGDEGLSILAPALGRLGVQIVAFENCELTDDSCASVARLIKAQEDRMDTAYWNATLRAGISDFNISSDTVHVLSAGMVAFSLSGNRFSGSKLGLISKVLKKNFWFLGLNLANNLITADEIKSFLQNLSGNNVIHAIILGGNPGFSQEMAILSTEIISRNESRLDRLPSYVEAHLQQWIRIQVEDSKPTLQLSNSTPSDATAVGTDGPGSNIISNPFGNSNAFAAPFHNNFFDNDEVAHHQRSLGQTNTATLLNNNNGNSNKGQTTFNTQEDFNLVDDQVIDEDSTDVSMEHATPTPPDFHHDRVEENISPSRYDVPTNLLSNKSSPREELDGRPPSRISLRPRAGLRDLLASEHNTVGPLVGDVMGSRQSLNSRPLDYDFTPTKATSMKNKFVNKTAPINLSIRGENRFENKIDDRSENHPESRENVRPLSAPPRYMSNPKSFNDTKRKLTGKITTARKSEYHPRRSSVLAIIGKGILPSQLPLSKSPASTIKRKSTPRRLSKPSTSASYEKYMNRNSILNKSPYRSPNIVHHRSLTPRRLRAISSDDSNDNKKDLTFQGTVKGTTEYFEQLSEAVLAATMNLATVSNKLQQVASSLSDTLSLHSQLINSQLQESVVGRQNTGQSTSKLFSPYSSSSQMNHPLLHPLSSSPKVSPPKSPKSPPKGSKISRSPRSQPSQVSQPSQSSQQSPKKYDIVNKVLLEVSAEKKIPSPKQVKQNENENFPEFDQNEELEISNLRDSFSAASENGVSSSIEDEDLSNLIRTVMRQKLTSLFSPMAKSSDDVE